MDEEKSINIFDEIFGTLDGVFSQDEETDGLKAIGAILTLSDEAFEQLKPILMSNIETAFYTPDAQIALAQMMNMQGIRIEDFTNNIDQLVESIGEITAEGVELSESKKDLLKFIFTSFANSMSESLKVGHRIITIPVELCRENAKLPTYATNGSAAMDIYSPEEYVIEPGETVLIPTGLKVNIPYGYALLIQPRSGLSRKTKLRVANTPGLIDCDYRQEIGVIIENIDPPLKDYAIQQDSEGLLQGPVYGSSYTIGKGERFAQMRLVEVPMVNWLPMESLGDFNNDHGEGFGSTGTT